MRNLKRNNILIMTLLLIVVLMSVGFAIISTTLNINGSAKIKSQSWNIYFSNINVSSGSVDAQTNAHIANESNTLVEYNVELDKPGDYYEFTVDAVNKGTLDAKIDSIVLNGIEGHEEYISYTATYLNGEEIKVGDALNSDTSETYKVRIEYKKDVSSLPTIDEELNLTFLVTYTQGHEGVIVTDYYTLTGTVYDDNGQPLRGGIVEVHSQVVSSEIDENGQYILKNVQIGEHKIVVKNESNEIVKEDTFTLIGGATTTAINNMVVAGSGNGVEINLLINEDVKLTTELPKHKVAIVGVNGESKTVNITRGSSEEISISPNEGYKYESMSCTDNTLIYNEETNKIAINNISENITCTINFALEDYNVVITGVNGTSSDFTMTRGTTKEVSITPNEGYKYQSLSCTQGENVTYNASTNKLTITGITKAITCTVTFIKACDYQAGYSWGFNYTGGMQSFTVPCSGTYKLEVYGAQGGDIGGAGGYGGYSIGSRVLSKNVVVYVGVGGKGLSFNGGGLGACSSDYCGAGGGGATHMALNTNATLAYTPSANVLIVAGGGGGGYKNISDNVSANGGTGGGLTGGNGTWSGISSGGATQSSGYAYGQGYNSGVFYSSGGGGGWYGGNVNRNYGSAGGGSGYIGGVASGSTIAGQRSGNGYAKITLVTLD